MFGTSCNADSAKIGPVRVSLALLRTWPCSEARRLDIRESLWMRRSSTVVVMAGDLFPIGDS